MDFDNTAQVQALSKLPPEPIKPPERSLWRTAADSLRGAGAKAMASALEVGDVIGPGLVADLDTRALDAAQRPIDFGQTQMSATFRDFERSLRPDPATAGKAEQLVYSLVGPAVGIVGAAVAGGVPGLAAAAGEMGFSESEELRQKGVDLGTRAAVGSLTAGVTALGGVLPLAGQTLKATAGLYLAGGPGAFMAQQAATSQILSRAGYGEIAKQYDALDPAGLALSALIPLPFAAAGAARNVRAARAPKAGEPVTAPVEPVAPEAVDAAMVHNLTLATDEIQAARAAMEADPTVMQRLAAEDVPPAVQRQASDAPEVVPAARAEPPPPDAIAAAVQDAAERLKGRSPVEIIDELRAAGDLPPLLNNALIAASEFAADPRRLRALMSDATARQGDPADALADAVERVRTLTDEQLTQSEAPPKPAADPLLQSVSSRVAVVEATAPTMPVGMNAEGRTVTAAEVMAQARREAQEGTDVELGSNDAALLQAAVDCALS